MKKKEKQSISDQVGDSDDFFSELYVTFLDGINLKALPVTLKVARGYFGQLVSNWIKINVPTIRKTHPGLHKKGFT